MDIADGKNAGMRERESVCCVCVSHHGAVQSVFLADVDTRASTSTYMYMYTHWLLLPVIHHLQYAKDRRDPPPPHAHTCSLCVCPLTIYQPRVTEPPRAFVSLFAYCKQILFVSVIARSIVVKVKNKFAHMEHPHTFRPLVK